MKLYVATDGSDASGLGTKERPFHTAAKLADALDPGDTGLFRSGIYDTVPWRTPGVLLTSPYGQHATLRGCFRGERTAKGAEVKGLILDGRTELPATPLIYADDFTLRECDISNFHTAIGVHATQWYAPDDGGAVGLLVEGCRIHHNGDLPSTNYDHGIYLGKTRGAIIRGNWIFANADRGVQLYSDSDDALIEHNVIDDNGAGVGIGGPSERNIVRRNVITNSTAASGGWNVYGLPGDGTDDEVYENVLWTERGDYFSGAPAHSGLQPERTGFTEHDNIVADPLYRGAATYDYRVPRASPARSIAPVLAKWLREL
jgi:hypothetical protein